MTRWFTARRRLLLAIACMAATGVAWGCTSASTVREATPAEIRAYFQQQRKTVLTFVGYSAAEYEDKAAMLAQATAVLASLDPKTVIVNIGATPDGIGAVRDCQGARLRHDRDCVDAGP